MANESRVNGWSRWGGVIVTATIAVLAFTVQWGVVTTKLDHVEKRLDELIVEARALRAEYQSIERRVAFLEGIHGGSRAHTGRHEP